MSDLCWQKSSFSEDGNNCVEIAPSGADIALRESDDPDRVVTARRAAFRGLVIGVKAGRLSAGRSRGLQVGE
ncbi:DUF397 domain-containing protein [Streptomyces xiamenensis]|uniref:DUF397 domain-containing protein n=1 Tax=Streptomyces xiamenensis TaxID=408015 RepID=UPI0037D1C52A